MSSKKKRIGSRRLLNQNIHGAHKPVDTANSTAAQEIPDKTTSMDPLVSPNSALSEWEEATGSRKKISSQTIKGEQHFTDFTSESHHKPTEEVAENTKYFTTVQTVDQPLERSDKPLARESEGPQFTADEPVNADIATKTQPITTKSQGSAIEHADTEAKSGRCLNDDQSEKYLPEIGKAQQGVLKEREAKQMPGILKVTFPPAPVTGETTCSVKLMESEEISHIHKLRAGSDDTNTKHDTEGLYQTRQDEEIKHTTEKTLYLESESELCKIKESEYSSLPTVNLRKLGPSRRRKERKQLYDELQQCYEVLETTAEETTVQSNTSHKGGSAQAQNNAEISAAGVKYKEVGQLECISSPKEEVDSDHMSKDYDLPEKTNQSEEKETVSEKTQIKDSSPENENRDKCSLNPTEQCDTVPGQVCEDEDQIKQRDEPSEVREILSSVQILHTDTNAPLTFPHQDISVSGENVIDTGSQIVAHKRKLGSSRKMKGRKQHDERSEENITPSEAIETIVIKEQSPETAVDNDMFESADQSKTTEVSDQQLDKDEEDTTLSSVLHINYEVSTGERVFTEQTQLGSGSQSEIYSPPKEQMYFVQSEHDNSPEVNKDHQSESAVDKKKVEEKQILQTYLFCENMKPAELDESSLQQFHDESLQHCDETVEDTITTYTALKTTETESLKAVEQAQTVKSDTSQKDDICDISCNDVSATDAENKERDEQESKEDKAFGGSHLSSETHDESDKSLITEGIFTKEESVREVSEPTCVVQSTIQPSPNTYLLLDPYKPDDLLKVNKAHQSAEALNKNEVQVTFTENMDHMSSLSESETHKDRENFSLKPTEQGEACEKQHFKNTDEKESTECKNLEVLYQESPGQVCEDGGQAEIKQRDEQPVPLQRKEPSEVKEILSSVQILHTDTNAPLTFPHQDISVSGENVTDTGSQIVAHKRKLGSSRKIKGRKQHDERSEENITPNEAIETIVIKEQSPETAVDNDMFQSADQSNTTEVSDQQLDKDEEDTTLSSVLHINYEVSTGERVFTEQTLGSGSQSEIYSPPKEQMCEQQLPFSSENEMHEERENFSVKAIEQDQTSVKGTDASSVELDFLCPAERDEKHAKHSSLDKKNSEPDQVSVNEHQSEDNVQEKDYSETGQTLPSEVSAPNSGPHLGPSRRKMGSSRRTKGSKHATDFDADFTQAQNVELTATDNEAICSTENKDVDKGAHCLQLSPTEETSQEELCSFDFIPEGQTEAVMQENNVKPATDVKDKHDQREMYSSSKEERDFDQISEYYDLPDADKTNQSEEEEIVPEETHPEDFISESKDGDSQEPNDVTPEDIEQTAAEEISSHRKHTETVINDIEQAANVQQDSDYRSCSQTAAEQSEDSVRKVEATLQTPPSEMDSQLNNDNLKEEIHSGLKTTQSRRKLGSSRRGKGRQNVEDSEGKSCNQNMPHLDVSNPTSVQFLCLDDELISQETQKEDAVMDVQSFKIKGLKEDHTEAGDSQCTTATGMDNTKSQNESIDESDTSREKLDRADPQTGVMCDAGDSLKKQQGFEDIDILDSNEKLQINSEQKRRKMGSTRRTQLNRKQEVEQQERDFNTEDVKDELLVTFTDDENSKPLPSVMFEEQQKEEASVTVSSIADEQDSSELHSQETKERSETAHKDKTEDGVLILVDLERISGATAHGTQEQNVCPRTDSEMKHSSPDLSLTDKKRKMGSTRKNLRISKRENEENETTVNVLNEGVLSRSGEKVENEDKTKGENYFESVDQCSNFSGSHSVHQKPDDKNPLGQPDNAEHLASEGISKDPEGSSKTGALTEAVVRKRKMGSHRKSHGDQSKGPGNSTDVHSEDATDKSVIQGLGKSLKLEQVLEVNESDNKAFSSSSTSGIKVESNPVSERPSEQKQPLLSSKGHLAQDSQIQLSSGYGKGPSLGACKYEVVMIGDSSVGKTSFIKRAQSGKFSFDLPASVGLDSFTWTVVVDGKRVLLHLWDTAGQERFHSMTKQIFHRAQAFLLMYDITCAQSFSAVSYWANAIKEGAAEDVVILLLGNKSDGTERHVKREEGEILAQEHNFAFMECSAATGENVIEALETIARLLSQNTATRENAMVLGKKPQQRNKFGCC